MVHRPNAFPRVLTTHLIVHWCLDFILGDPNLNKSLGVQVVSILSTYPKHEFTNVY